MSSQVTFSSVFRLGLKILCSTFNYLYLFEPIFAKIIFMFLLSHFRWPFSQKKIKKTSEVITTGSALKKVYFIFYWKERIGNSLTNHWLGMY